MKNGIIVLVIIIILFTIGVGIMKNMTEKVYQVTVTEKQVKRSDDADKYLIYTQLEDGQVRVFENTDSLLKFKFNSSDVYARIQVNGKYRFTVVGFRIPILSAYENIIKVQKIE